MTDRPTIRFAEDLMFLGSPLPPTWVCESKESRGEGLTAEGAYQHWLMNLPKEAGPQLPWWRRAVSSAHQVWQSECFCEIVGMLPIVSALRFSLGGISGLSDFTGNW